MPKKNKQPALIFSSQDSLGQFHAYLSSLGLSQNTLVNYQRDIRTFLTATGEIKSDEFQRCAAAWLNIRRQTLAPKTIGRNLSSLKAFAKAYKIELDTLDVYKLPMPLPAKPHPLRGGIAAVRQMVDASNTADHSAVVGLCGLAGLRISEAVMVRACDFDMVERKLKVIGKGQREREIPVSDELWESVVIAFVRALGTPEGHQGRLVQHNERAARRAITALGKRAGIPGSVASHDLRATFATAVWNKTHDLRLVQVLLGHSSPSVTQLYLGIDEDELAAAVRF